MNTTHTLEQMQQLRLHGMYHSYKSQLELPMDQQLEGHELLAHLIGSEQLARSTLCYNAKGILGFLLCL